MDILNEEIVKEVALTLGAIALLVLVVYVINRLFKFFYAKIDHLTEKKMKSIKVKNYEILSPKYVSKFIVAVFKILRIVIILIAFYFWLFLLFGIFPATKGISDALFGYILKPIKSIWKSFIDFLPSLFFIVVVLIIVKYINRLLKFFANEIAQERLQINGFYKEWGKPTFLLIRLVVYAFTLIIIFPYLPGSSSPAFQGVGVFMGVLLSLGSTDFVANAVGGLMMIYMRPFAIGDVVKIGDTTGKVITKGLLVTRLKTSKNEEVSLPNKTITQNKIINYSSEEKDGGVFIHTTVTIGYDVEWRKVHEVMIEASNRTKGIENAPKPYVLQTALNDFSVAYELNAYCKEPTKMPLIYSLLHQNLQDCFNENGIEILSPHYRVDRIVNESTIPEKYR